MKPHVLSVMQVLILTPALMKRPAGVKVRALSSELSEALHITPFLTPVVTKLYFEDTWTTPINFPESKSHSQNVRGRRCRKEGCILVWNPKSIQGSTGHSSLSLPL